MKYNSARRLCLFSAPQFKWGAATEDLGYPSIKNIVSVLNKHTGAYTVYVAVPTEIYIVMKQQGVARIDKFILSDKLFSMQTDIGVIPLWIYKTIPKSMINCT